MIALAPALAMALLIAPAAEDPEPPRRVALEIDHTPLLESQEAPYAEETATFLREDGVAALQRVHGAEVVEDATAPAIVVELRWIDYASSLYQITMWTRRAGEDPRELATFECACIDSGVIESVLDRLPAALAQLAEEPPAPEEPPEVEPEPEQALLERAAPSSPVEDPEPRPRPIGALGITGAVVVAGGLGMIGFGISRLAKGEERSRMPDDERFGLHHDFRPQGRAWLGAGVGAAAAGTALLIVDLTVLRRQRAARVALGPIGSPWGAGLRLRGRF